MQAQRIQKKLPAALAALVPALLGLSAATVQNTAPPAAPAPELPSARAIIDRFSEVTGGKALVEKTSSMHMKGTIDLESMGMKGEFERFSAKPSKQLIKQSLGSFGTTVIGYDGEVGWMTSPMLGTLLLEGTEQFQTVMQSAYDVGLMPAEDYEKLEVQGREMFEGVDCYKVLAVYKAPADPEEAKATEKVRTSTAWYAVESGLQIGTKGTGVQAGMEIPTMMTLADYKKFGDYTFPARMVQEGMGVKVAIILDKVEYDQVDPKVFEVPESVRALLKDAKEPVPAGSGSGGG